MPPSCDPLPSGADHTPAGTPAWHVRIGSCRALVAVCLCVPLVSAVNLPFTEDFDGSAWNTLGDPGTGNFVVIDNDVENDSNNPNGWQFITNIDSADNIALGNGRSQHGSGFTLVTGSNAIGLKNRSLMFVKLDNVTAGELVRVSFDWENRNGNNDGFIVGLWEGPPFLNRFQELVWLEDVDLPRHALDYAEVNQMTANASGTFTRDFYTTGARGDVYLFIQGRAKGNRVMLVDNIEVEKTGDSVTEYLKYKMEGYWPFNGNGDDLSVHNIDAVPSGGPGYVGGKIGQSVDLNANGKFFTLGKDDIDNVWTVAFWINKQTSGATGVLLDSPGYSLRAEQFNNTESMGITDKNGTAVHHDFNYTLPNNQWKHVVVVGTPWRVDVYVDGIAACNPDLTATIGVLHSKTGLQLPLDKIGDGSIRAQIDELAVWSRELGVAEIHRLYLEGNNGRDLNQVAGDYTRETQGLTGPGIPLNRSYADNQVISSFKPEASGAPSGGLSPISIYYNGWMVINSRGDANRGGTVIYDYSDPASPKRVSHWMERGRPQHGLDVVIDDQEGNFVTFRSNSKEHEGIGMLFDLDQLPSVEYARNLPYKVPTTHSQTSVILPPYAYTGHYGYNLGTTNLPLEIIDMRDGSVVSSFSTLDEHGFRGVPVVIGNLMLVTGSNSDRGVASYDISDPANPVLLDTLPGDNSIVGFYEPCVFKNYLVGGEFGPDANSVHQNRISFVDFSDPSDLKLTETMPHSIVSQWGNSEYQQFQDDTMFACVRKWDTSPLATNGTPIEIDRLQHGAKYAHIFGNLILGLSIRGDTTTVLQAHEPNPDTTRPTVSFNSPLDGATDQHVKSRIAVVIHENLELGTINRSNFMVREQGTSNNIGGIITASDNDVITYSPRADLTPGTTYEVVIVDNGITDVSGNGVHGHTFTFTTAGTSGTDNVPPTVDSISVSSPSVTTGTDITLTATASDNNGAVEYQWENGTWGATNTFTTSFGTEGHHSVELRVRDAAGNVVLKTYSVAVVNPPSGIAPSSSNRIALDDSRRKVWAVNPDNGTVTAVDADTRAKTGEYAVGAGPEFLALDGNGDVWISCADANEIRVLDGDNGNLLHTIDTGYGSSPHGIAYNATTNRIFVALRGSGEVSKINPDNRNILSTLLLGANPYAIAVNGDGTRAFVTKFISEGDQGAVWEIDADAASMTLTRTFDLAKSTNTDTSKDGRGVPNYLSDAAIHPNNDRVWISGSKANVDRGEFRESTPQPESVAFQNSVRTLTSVLDLGTNTEISADRIDHDNNAFPSGTVFSPNGDYAFVLMRGNGRVLVYDILNTATTFKLNIATGFAPDGAVFDPATGRLFVKNFMSRSVTAVDLSGFLELGLPPVSEGHTSTVASEALAGEVLAGKQIFYNAEDLRMSEDGYLSCASCHDDGGQDGIVWDFTERGEGLRNTISLKGRRGTGHGRVHWSANFDEIQDFEHDIRGPQSGNGFMTNAQFNTGTRNTTLGDAKAGVSADLDALAAYVASLSESPESPHRDSDGTMTASAINGEQHFLTLNCTSCHQGDDYTDSASGILHDIGTIKAGSGQRLGAALTGIDTPTLRGIWNTAPYLHDGSAADLAAVFNTTNAPGNSSAHGVVRGLSSAEQTELIDFLLQIDGSNGASSGGARFVFEDDFESAAWAAIADPASNSHADISSRQGSGSNPGGWQLTAGHSVGQTFWIGHGRSHRGPLTTLTSKSLGLKNWAAASIAVTASPGDTVDFEFDWEVSADSDDFHYGLMDGLPNHLTNTTFDASKYLNQATLNTVSNYNGHVSGSHTLGSFGGPLYFVIYKAGWGPALHIDNVMLSVVSPNTAPAANAGSDQTGAQAVADSDGVPGEEVMLDGSGSSDSDGSISSWVWKENGSQIATGVTPTVNLSDGLHTIVLTVTDDDGATNSDTVLVEVMPDADSDGMPGAWEDANGLDKTVDDSGDDDDHDGTSNLMEYRAGTDPQNPNSVFRAEITDLDLVAGELDIEWNSAAGRSYRIHQSPDLGNWTPLTGFLPATPPLNQRTLSLPADADRWFLRIEPAVD